MVDVAMREYRFDYRPPTTAGRTVFRVRNAGHRAHELTLVPLPEDLPPIKTQLGSKKRRSLPPLFFLPPRGPGSSDTFAVDLPPGRYALLCFLVDSDKIAHALKGMNSEFRVR